MKTTEECLSEVVATVDTEAFPDALIEWMNKAVPNDNIALLAYYQDRKPEIFFARSKTPEVHADLDSSYLDGAYLLDPLHELHIIRAPSDVYRVEDIAPDHFSRNQYFIDYYAQTTMVDEIAFVAYPSKGVSLQLCLGRDKKSKKKFSSKQLKEARAIHPIVAALLNRQWSDLNTTGSFDEGNTLEKMKALAEEVHGVRLTHRQAEIVLLILKGHSSNSIALHLTIAYQTVKVFRRQIFKKCRISSQAELFNMFVPLVGRG